VAEHKRGGATGVASFGRSDGIPPERKTKTKYKLKHGSIPCHLITFLGSDKGTEHKMAENNSVYIEIDDGWATPCCGICMWGDIIENETLCPYCEKTFELDEENEDAEI
jgi:hypothetical protein